MFLDADTVPRTGWLREMVAPFEQPDVVAVKGRYYSRQTGHYNLVTLPLSGQQPVSVIGRGDYAFVHHASTYDVVRISTGERPRRLPILLRIHSTSPSSRTWSPATTGRR